MLRSAMNTMPTGAQVKPLLARNAVERTGHDRIPGYYCEARHVWIVDDRPIVQTHTSLAELTTKTDAMLERDDTSETSLLEMQTKTRAEVEQDDQDFNIFALGLSTKTFASLERDD